MLLAFGSNSGSFSVISSISEISSGFLFPLVDMVFLMDGGMSLEVAKVVIFFWGVFIFFDIIVDKFAEIGRLNGRFVVGNHASRTGTLTP